MLAIDRKAEVELHAKIAKLTNDLSASEGLVAVLREAAVECLNGIYPQRWRCKLCDKISTGSRAEHQSTCALSTTPATRTLGRTLDDNEPLHVTKIRFILKISECWPEAPPSVVDWIADACIDIVPRQTRTPGTVEVCELCGEPVEGSGPVNGCLLKDDGEGCPFPDSRPITRPAAAGEGT